MGASRYIRRVGGLAVALGVGAAILTGQGVAYADTGTSDQSSVAAKETNAGPATDARPEIRLKLPRIDAVAVESLKTVASESATARRSAATKTSSDTAAKPLNAVVAQTAVRRKSAPTRPDVTVARVGKASDAGEPRLAGVRAAIGRAEQIVGKLDNAVERTADPQAVSAARSTSIQVPQQSPRILSTFISSVLNPFAGTSPTSPTSPSAPTTPTDSPASVILLAGTRRELSAGQSTPDANIAVVGGVIRGTVTVSKLTSQNLTYTVVTTPSGFGKVDVDTTGKFTYLPYATGANADGSPTFAPSESFTVLVAVKSPLDSALEKIPVLGDLVQPILVQLHQIPILGELLSPIIGRSEKVTIGVADAALAAAAPGPIAFTTTVTSFDQTPISVNWFPALNLPAGQTDAPTILNGPSLATAGYTNPDQTDTVFGLVPGLKPLREAGYNVVTWDPRGEFASGGTLELDSPDFEAKDVSAIIDWVATQPTTQFDTNMPGDTDPRIGMVGGSYGGGIQLTSARTDTRIDAIAPGIAWNNLTTTLYPNDAFKTSFASLLLLSLVVSGSRINPEIYSGIATGALLGVLTQGQQDFLNSSSPSNVVGNIQIPTLLLQGTVDTLFPLNQAITNAEAIGEDDGPTVKMIWYCGGHGQCLDPVDAAKQTAFLKKETIAWMDTYVKNMDTGQADGVPNFQWVDQNGDLYSSKFLPVEGSELWKDSTPITVTDDTRRVLPDRPRRRRFRPADQGEVPGVLGPGGRGEKRDQHRGAQPRKGRPQRQDVRRRRSHADDHLLGCGDQPRRVRPTGRHQDQSGGGQHRHAIPCDSGRQGAHLPGFDGGHRVHHGFERLDELGRPADAADHQLRQLV
jgi:ABC-2 type transport system ATP-binding protein